jgi:hypothetical protein
MIVWFRPCEGSSAGAEQDSYKVLMVDWAQIDIMGVYLALDKAPVEG